MLSSPAVVATNFFSSPSLTVYVRAEVFLGPVGVQWVSAGLDAEQVHGMVVQLDAGEVTAVLWAHTHCLPHHLPLESQLVLPAGRKDIGSGTKTQTLEKKPLLSFSTKMR